MSGATIRMVTVGLIWVWLVDSVGGVFVCLFCFFWRECGNDLGLNMVTR